MYLKFYFIVNVEMIFARIYKNKFESDFSMVNNRCYIFDHIYPGLVGLGLEKVARGLPLPNRQVLEHSKCVYIRLTCACCIVIFLQVYTLQITDTTGSHQFPAMQRLSISKKPRLRPRIFSDRPTVVRGVENRSTRKYATSKVTPKTTFRSYWSVTRATNRRERWPLTRSISSPSRGSVTALKRRAKTDHNVKELFQELLQSDKAACPPSRRRRSQPPIANKNERKNWKKSAISCDIILLERVWIRASHLIGAGTDCTDFRGLLRALVQMDNAWCCLYPSLFWVLKGEVGCSPPVYACAHWDGTLIIRFNLHGGIQLSTLFTFNFKNIKYYPAEE